MTYRRLPSVPRIRDSPSPVRPDEGLISTVREGGFEPPRPCGHWHLKPARLPFRHSRVWPSVTDATTEE